VSEFADFIQAISQAPDDDTGKLVFADWLEDEGAIPELAGYVRRVVELGRTWEGFCALPLCREPWWIATEVSVDTWDDLVGRGLMAPIGLLGTIERVEVRRCYSRGVGTYGWLLDLPQRWYRFERARWPQEPWEVPEMFWGPLLDAEFTEWQDARRVLSHIVAERCKAFAADVAAEASAVFIRRQVGEKVDFAAGLRGVCVTDWSPTLDGARPFPYAAGVAVVRNVQAGGNARKRYTLVAAGPNNSPPTE